jgi:uncharacterized membrane protein
VRSLQLQVRSAHAARVLVLAHEHGAQDTTAVRAERVRREGTEESGDWSLVFLNLPNDRVGSFVEALRSVVDDAGLILLPVGALPLEAPVDRLDRQVRDVSRLSTLELVVASLQSVGSWRGMLLFSLLAGVIGAYGLLFDVGYLLVAAMLINPMGAPALVAVVGLAIGDARMFGRGGVRFLVSLAVQAIAAAALGFGYSLSVSTATMEQVASLSTWAVVVALAAGAAGAQTQVKSDRDSLVSGTAAGFMVAAALAPPAAVLGLSVPLARWDYAALMAFLLALQFLAIAAGGAAVLHGFGVRPARPSIGRGSARVRAMLAAGVAVAILVLVAWQTGREPGFHKADLSRAAMEIARDALDEVPEAYLLEASARFTRRDLERYRPEGLLFEIIAERAADAAPDSLLERAIREAVRRRVDERMRGVVPFVRIDLVPGTPGAGSP